MAGRLWFRLLIGTCIVLAVTLGAVILLLNKALTGSFQEYVEDQQSARIQRAESIISRYYDRRREWTGVEPTVQSSDSAQTDQGRLLAAGPGGYVVAGGRDGSLVAHDPETAARLTERRTIGAAREKAIA